MKPLNLYQKDSIPNVGPKDHPFEIRITDLWSKRVYAMTIKFPSQTFRDKPIECFETLRVKFDQLCNCLWAAGSLPQVSVEVVDVPPTQEPQESKIS